MKSRISIEVDFNNNNQAVLKILHQNSDDVRDKLLSSFLEKFGGDSSWCRISWLHHIPDETQTVFISPISISELPQEIIEMGNRVKDSQV